MAIDSSTCLRSSGRRLGWHHYHRVVVHPATARARGHAGGRPYTMTPAKVRLAMAAMGKLETNVSMLCAELGISRQTLYRHVSPEGSLRPDGEKLLARKRYTTCGWVMVE